MLRASWTTALLLGFSFTTLEALASSKSAPSPKPPSSGSKPAPSSGSKPSGAGGGHASNPGAQFGFTPQGWKAFSAGYGTSSAEQYFKSMTPAQQAQAVKQFNASGGSGGGSSASKSGSKGSSMASSGSNAASLLGNGNYSSALGGLLKSGSSMSSGYGGSYAYRSSNGLGGYGTPSYGMGGYGMPSYGMGSYGMSSYSLGGYGMPSYGLGGYGMPFYGLGGLPMANAGGLAAPGSTPGGAGYVDHVLQSADDVAVRVLRLPKADPPYTPEQLKELKGPDTALPGYRSDFDNVREGQTIRVNLARQRTDPADPSKVRWIPVRQLVGKLISVGGTNKQLTLRVTTRNGNGKEVPIDADQVTMIVIIADPL
jgi:hypothetical protein